MCERQNPPFAQHEKAQGGAQGEWAEAHQGEFEPLGYGQGVERGVKQPAVADFAEEASAFRRFIAP